MSPAPFFSRKSRNFGRDAISNTSVLMYPENTRRYGILSRSDWTSLTPGNKGTDLVTTPDGGEKLVTLSMFHQLGCLDVVREELTAISDEWEEYEDRPKYCHQGSRWGVVQHCMNYLRQMSQCHSHTALESVRAATPPAIVDLTKSQYHCYDWGAVYKEWDIKQRGV
ncbi:hypothetical protein DFP72DRAFT_464924 [Ephemerocybe angulata]|uniref:Uncharacterized protein n=1 Tax=Ephemerocybe angulata TaxID=980116 RepID=A0A8H6HS23_9AGAR|nr:hypothetical protein DFP72DRAFT_464924 [Tulosesus angulatus]